MRRMPLLQQGNVSILMTDTFRGYNHTDVIMDGEMYDMKNLSADNYPMVSTRKKRWIRDADSDELFDGILGGQEMTLVTSKRVQYGNQTVGITINSTSEHIQMVKLGTYVCIWPDKKFFNTLDLSECGDMERHWRALDQMPDTITTDDLPKAQICRLDGTDYDMTAITVSATAPVSPDNGDLWIDQSGEADVLRQYSTADSRWVEVPTVYVKISCKDIGKGLNMYDSVNIKALEWAHTVTPGPSERVKEQLKTLNGEHVVYAAGDNYIIVAGILSTAATLDYLDLKVDREVPDLDYIVESKNRLWGCRYGVKTKYKTKSLIGYSTNATLCDIYGNAYDANDITLSGTEPSNPSNGDLWIDTSAEYNDGLKEYKSASSEWVKVKTYVKLSCENIGTTYDRGIKVQVSSLGGRSDLSIRENAQIRSLSGNKELVSAADDYIIYEGFIDLYFEHIGDSGPRDRYSIKPIAEKSEQVNEIRACKLGDFRNWNCYMGLSTDSYVMSVGTEGPFTGACMQLGYPIFFKENCIHRIFGETPDSFQLSTTMCEGVQEGSDRSVAVANEAIYYKSIHGVMMYDGNMPINIGEKLGSDVFIEGVGGIANGKYYLKVEDKNNKWHLFVYDTRYKTWHREDNLGIEQFANVKGALIGIAAQKLFYVEWFNTIHSGQYALEEDFDWEAVFGLSGVEYRQSGGYTARYENRGNQYLSRFDIRMYLPEESKADLWIEYDSSGTWKHQGTIRGKKLQSFMIPVIPRRCDHLRIKMTGTGEMKIYSISRLMEAGSDG